MVNTTAAIMALPGPLEQIRLVGDEEKHATLLFFGETSTLPNDAKQNLLDSVKMACDMLSPFSEVVREISRLGTENPPALVAMLSDRNLSQVRSLFMMNPNVKGYLNNTPQFVGFMPHVTLGHPDFADEVILRALASQLFRVQFDRLAVWWNDEVIECPLNQAIEGDTLAQVEAIGDSLAHARATPVKTLVKRATAAASGDRKVFFARGKAAGQTIVPKVGDKFQHQGIPHTVVKTKKLNASMHLITARPSSNMKSEGAAHSEVSDLELFEAEIDASEVDLEHSGVKGMKWGIRRPRDSATGLVRRSSSEDKIHVDRIASKLAKNGTSALSNKDLQDFARRLQLEADFRKATSSPEAQKGRSWVNNFIRSQGGRQFDRVANKAIDIAVEQAIKKAGVKISTKNPDLGKNTAELAKRLAPKKGK